MQSAFPRRRGQSLLQRWLFRRQEVLIDGPILSPARLLSGTIVLNSWTLRRSWWAKVGSPGLKLKPLPKDVVATVQKRAIKK